MPRIAGFKFARQILVAITLMAMLCLLPAAQCFDTGDIGIYYNSTDPTNDGATYVGSAACRECHPSYSDRFELHGHGHALKRVEGSSPSYPAGAVRAGVPNPPSGKSWSDVSYVVGGHNKGALFIDLDGYLMTNGQLGVDTRWDLSFPPNGTTAEFAPYLPAATTPPGFDYTCFQCHTTGAQQQDANHPRFQDNRPGIAGTWQEEGAQCESCHGPGSNHIPNPFARNLFVSSTAESCGKCHAGTDPNIIASNEGYIAHNQQYAELLASGGHEDFSCLFCHDSHNSTVYDRQQGIRNNCTACHTDQNMALHDGKVFVRGDYTETLTCESCHMPYATRTSSAASTAVVGPNGRMGDTRTHIFRISREAADFNTFFSGPGDSVLKDSDGRAAVTVDFVCLRCHNGVGTFNLTVSRAAEIAPNLHLVFPP